MTKKAAMDLMDQLHALTAESLSKIIAEGLPVINKETGEVVGYEPAPASYISAAIKFLKDNDGQWYSLPPLAKSGWPGSDRAATPTPNLIARSPYYR